jgi:hypothetical protein
MTLTPLNNKTLTALLASANSPCISLYQPTHRQHPESQQDPIRFRNLIKDIEKALHSAHDANVANELMEPLNELAADEAFWNHTLDGLAVFAALGVFQVFGLPRSVPELTVVADSFHTKPLRRFLQSMDRYQLLGLSLQGVKLYEGTRDGLHAIEFAPGVPDAEGVIPGEDSDGTLETDATNAAGGIASKATPHTQGGRQNESGTDESGFFREIDRIVLEQHSRPSGLPLILAALPEHHGLFHELSHNPFLLPEGITNNPDALPLAELCERAWQVFEPQYQTRLAAVADEYQIAKSGGLGLDELDQIAEAAVAGRVGTLLIEADRQINGRIHPGTGNLHLEAPDESDSDDLVDDLLDDLGEWVLKMGGLVMVIPTDLMPTTTGAAATCRY